MVLVAAPYALGLDDAAAYALWAVGPVLGMVLLAPGATRQLGTGLVASALTLPLLLLALVLLGEV